MISFALRFACSRVGVGRAVVLAGVALLFLPPVAAAVDDFAGRFEGDGLRLELESDDGGYEGVLTFQGQSFPCRARRGGDGLVGSFDSQTGSYPFEVRPAGDGVALTSGGKTYSLRRLGSGGNPLAGGAASNPLAGSGAAGAGSGFAGQYRGAIEGTPAVLALEQRGAEVTGSLDASGYPYSLRGSISGGKLSGQIADPQTGGGTAFEATLRGDSLEIVLLTQDPYTGQQRRTPMSFQRGTGAGQTPSADGLGAGTPPAAPQGQRDPALAGVWRQSESMSGGGASMVVESFLRINPDGTFALGGGRAVGGGAGWGGDTGSGGVEETGYWKSENRIVYVQGTGGGGWQPYARYYVEAGKLMFTFGDGSRQIWYRVQ